MAVLLHEFAHGMGFQQFASVTTGARPLNFDDVFNVHIFDNRTQKSWPQMTNAERAAAQRRTTEDEALDHDPVEIQRLLAWYFRTENPVAHGDGERELRDAA